MSVTAGIVSKRLNLSYNFFESGSPIIEALGPLAPISNSKGNPFSGGVKYTGVGKIGDFRRITPFISETVLDRPIVTMEH